MPLERIVEHLLMVSDNDAAEVIFRQAAIGAGRSGSIAEATKVVRAELSLDEAEVIALALEAAAIALHPTRAHLAKATRIACELGCPAYDCFYLALAQELRQPLVTADLRLADRVRTGRARRFAKLVVPLREIGTR